MISFSRFTISSTLLSLTILLVGGTHCQRQHPQKNSTPKVNPAKTQSPPLAASSDEASLIFDGDNSKQLQVRGKISFSDQRITHVFSPVSGRVKKVLVKPGTVVDVNTPLAIIDSPDVSIAYTEFIKAEADLKIATSELTRQQDLTARQATSARDLEIAEDNFKKAKAEFKRAEEKITLLNVTAEKQLKEEYILRSYTRGEVMESKIHPGMEISGLYSNGNAKELFIIGNIDEVWLFADIKESMLAQVKLNMNIAAKVIAYPDKIFLGKIDWIASTVEPNLRTIKIRANLQNDAHELKPGMYASILLDSSQTNDLKTLKTQAEALLKIQHEEPELLESSKKYAVEGYLTKQQKELAEIVFSPISEASLSDSMLIGGRLTFDDLRITHIYSPIAGRVSKVLVKQGDRVKKNAPLAYILSPELNDINANLLKAEAEFIASKREYLRQQELYTAHAGALKDLELALSEFHKAQAELKNLKERLQILGLNTTNSREFILKSPIDGEIISRHINEGLEIEGQYSGGSGEKELFTIGDLDKLWVIGEIYEIELPLIQEGSKIYIKSSIYPQLTFDGQIEWIADMVDSNTHTVALRGSLDNKDLLLKPEMYETITVSIPGKHMLVIPRNAAIHFGNEIIVFVLTAEHPDGSISFKPRQILVNEDKTGNLLTVLHGLHPGEKIATKGAILLAGVIQNLIN